MKELSALAALAAKPVSESAIPSDEVRFRRAWFNKTDQFLDPLQMRIIGTDGNGGSMLKKMLQDGKFPETESRAMIEAFNEFMDAYEDFKMGLLMETDEE